MYHLRVLGQLEITDPTGRSVEGLIGRSRRAALLAYLGAAAPRGPHRRDKLLAIFWPESDDVHARAALNQAIYVLRSQLGDDAVLTRGDEVGLSDAAISCDVADFERAVAEHRYADARRLYRGDLLEGFHLGQAPEFENWISRERTRLKRVMADAAWMHAEALAAAGDLEEAAHLAKQSAALLPGDELVVRRLMTFLRGIGDRAAAIHEYDAFVAELKREYELEPSAETAALAQAIRDEERDVRSVVLPVLPPVTRFGTLLARLTRAPRPVVGGGALLSLVVLAAFGAWMTEAGFGRSARAEREPSANRSRPTVSDVAYDYYVRGQAYSTSGFSSTTNQLAREMFEKAIAADSGFALAWARLAHAHAAAYWFHLDRSPERRELARQAAARALALRPDLPEAHLAMGYYLYWGHQALEEALASFQTAERLGMTDAELYLARANVLRRQGKLSDAIENNHAAVARDPQSHGETFELAFSYAVAFDTARAAHYFDRAIQLNPDPPRNYWQKVRLYLGRSPDLVRARQTLSHPGAPMRDSLVQFYLAWVEALEGHGERALRRLDTVRARAIEFQFRFVPKAQMQAAIHASLGRVQTARNYYDSARGIAEARLRERPELAVAHSALAVALAGLGRGDEALAHANQGITLQPLIRDAINGLFRLEERARVYWLLGDHATAERELARLRALAAGTWLPTMELGAPWALSRSAARQAR